MGSPAPWNYLWKPGPHPETDDERRAAAKKYGMIYEDYKPSNEPDTMMGDYPQLPVEPAHEKNALYEWDLPEYRRNYGEPLHEEWWQYQEIRLSPMTKYRYTRSQMYATQFGFFVFLYIFHKLTDGDYWIPRLTQQRMEFQLAKDGPHYTFEPLE